MARLLTIALTAILFVLLLAPGASAQVDYPKFRQEFDQAAKLGSKSKMDRLMKDEQGSAIYWIQVTAEQISVAPSDILYERYDALRGAWNRVYETDFPDKMEQFFAYSDTTTKRDRHRFKQKYDKMVKARVEAQAAKNAGKLNALAGEFKALAAGFGEIGDMWMESQSSLNLAAVLEEEWHGKRTDFNRLTDAYARGVALREELGVRDRTYRGAVPRLRALTGLGFGSAGAAGGASGSDEVVPTGPEKAGVAVEMKMEFVALDAKKDNHRPNYYLDQHQQIWPSIDLGAVASTAKFVRIEGGPTVIRESASKAVIDVDGDGKGDMPWPTRGKLEVVTFDIGTGMSRRTWSVLSDVGRQKDYYQGIEINLQATDGSFRIFFVPAGSLVGDLGGVRVQVIDDNIDGIYGSAPTMWHHMGITEGTQQPEFDSIRIGSSKRSQPWSEYVNVGKAGWHKLESVNGGAQIRAQKVEFKTGTLQVKAKGLKPDFFIMHGLGNDLAETYIDVAGGKKVEVPIGRWELSWGIVRKGKKMQAMKAIILPSNGMKVYDVREGADVVIEIGAPYSFDFEYEVTKDKVIVSGDSVRVLGSAGEAYERVYGAVPKPEAGVRKKGGKRASASKVLRPVADNGGVVKHGWKAMWKPLPGEIPKKGGEVEVQLIEKKNKLFGSIGSDWK